MGVGVLALVVVAVYLYYKPGFKWGKVDPSPDLTMGKQIGHMQKRLNSGYQFNQDPYYYQKKY